MHQQIKYCKASVFQFWMTLNAYCTGLDLWNVYTVWCREMCATFWLHCSQCCEYSDLTTWHPRWKIPLENPCKCHFRDSKFQNTLDAVCLWRKLQSRLLFIISLLLENFLTALTCKLEIKIHYQSVFRRLIFITQHTVQFLSLWHTVHNHKINFI